ncbi:DUF1810 domain-containing protein [Primorskyibacter sp. S87]|uniref:DUF1810 domain-containing protein n=1 Tax=Primorskyibacter sp. S87 TaxID=3415126 RepID=UPI003C79DEF8
MIETNLKRFIDAQDKVWSDVLRELSQGQKTSHWIWFVFPQLASLGRSHTAQRYGISGLNEAAEYLGNDILRNRLREACSMLLKHEGRDATDILGNLDAMKLRSSMTLFSHIPGAPEEIHDVLRKFYGGKPCRFTSIELAS